MSILKEFLKRNRSQKLKVHCVGDAMIDEYYDVKVNRISPEFPMPIMWSSEDNPARRPGGAANVAYQFRHFNVQAHLISFQDQRFDGIFSACGVENFRPCFDNIRFTMPVKRRFLDNGTQVVRHDIESPLYGTCQEVVNFAVKHIFESVEASLPQPDVVVFSDYDKGFFKADDMNYMSVYHGVKTIVDPKRGPLSKWKGCTILKPNAKEAEQLSGKTTWREQAKYLQTEAECEGVVITSGGERVAGVWKDEFFCFTPTTKSEVQSVVGAGDCFCALFALAIGHGFTVPEAAEIGWTAGSVYVQGRMNRPIVPAELVPNHLVEPEDLASRDFKLVFTNGCFDLIHEGHLATLKFAKEQGDRLVVAVNSDSSVRRLKGDTRPFMPLAQRAALLASLKHVDFVVVLDDNDPTELIKKIRPDVLVKGEEYKKEEIIGANLVPVVVQAPMISGISTSNLLRRYFSQQQF